MDTSWNELVIRNIKAYFKATLTKEYGIDS